MLNGKRREHHPAFFHGKTKTRKIVVSDIPDIPDIPENQTIESWQEMLLRR